MKAGIESKISTWTFAALMVVSAVVLFMFFCVGWDNYEMMAAGSTRSPENTDMLLWWMYILTAVCSGCMVVFLLWQFFATLKTNPRGAFKGLLYLVFLVALVGVSYSLADDSALLINGNIFNNAGTLVFTDVCIYVQYVLLFVTTLCTIVSLCGVFKSVNKVKA